MKFDEILQRYEDSLMAYNRAAGLMDKGRLDEAEELLKAALSRYPREIFMDEEQEIDASMLDSIDTLFTNISDRLELVKSIRSGPKLGASGILTLRDLVERNALKKKTEPEPAEQDGFSPDASVELDYTESKLDDEVFERVWNEELKPAAEDIKVGAGDSAVSAPDTIDATPELSAEEIILSGMTDIQSEKIEPAAEEIAPEPEEKSSPEIAEALVAIEAFEQMDAGNGGKPEKGEFDNIEIDVEAEPEAPAAAEEAGDAGAAPMSAEEEKSLADMLAGTLTDAPLPEDLDFIDEKQIRAPEPEPETERPPAPEKIEKALEALTAAAGLSVDASDESASGETPESVITDTNETAAADGDSAPGGNKKTGFFSKLSALKKQKKTKKNEPQEAELLEMSDEGPANTPEEPPDKPDEEAGGPKKMKKLKLFSIGKNKKDSGEELKDVPEQAEEVAAEEPSEEIGPIAAEEEPAVEVSAAFSTPPAPAPAPASDDEKDEEDEALLSKDEIKKQYGPAHKHTIIERTTVNVSGIFSTIFIVIMLLAGFADLGYRIYTDVYLGGLDSLYRGGEKAVMSDPVKLDDALTNFLQYRTAMPDAGADKNKVSAYIPVSWSVKLRNEMNKPDDALMLMRLVRREDVRAAALDEEFVNALIMKAEQGVSGGGEEFEELTSRARQVLAEGRVAEPISLAMLGRLDALEAGSRAAKTSGK